MSTAPTWAWLAVGTLPSLMLWCFVWIFLGSRYDRLLEERTRDYELVVKALTERKTLVPAQK
jgi:hypothetical protein